MWRESLRLGRFRGVPIEVHFSFMLLPIWIILQHGALAVSWADLLFAPADLLGDPFQRAAFARLLLREAGQAGMALVMLGLVFGSVLIHEIGHALRAQSLGIPVRRILLLPIGGLAELARAPEHPRDELRLALAGPVVNVGLALVCAALAAVWIAAGGLPARTAFRALAQGGQAALAPPGLWINLALINLLLALSNLLPAFPLDGGRMLRSLMALRLPRLAATRLVASLSWIGAVLLTIGAWKLAPSLGFSGAASLALMAVVLVGGAHIERVNEENRRALQGIAARDALRQPTWTLAPTDVVGPQLISAFFLRPTLPVVVGQRLVGVVARDDLLAALRRRMECTIAHIMRTRFAYVRAEESLWRAQQLLAADGAGQLPVLDGESLQGVLTAADVQTARRYPPSPLQVRAPVFISGAAPQADAAGGAPPVSHHS